MSQAYEMGLGEQSVSFLGGGLSIQEQRPPQDLRENQYDQTNQPEENHELARVLPLSAALVRHAVHEEAMNELATVVPLEIARHAVNEAYGFTPSTEDDTTADVTFLLPTGTSNETHVSAPQHTYDRPQLVDDAFVATHESIVKHHFSSRGARRSDIEALVDVDMKAFESVYKDYDMTHEELRAELIEKFTGRFDKVGSDWIRLVEKDGIIAGFMTCCPTNKTPEEFESWEKTTDNGTLDSTYDPNGKNVYVVSLSMLPGVGEAARNMLFADQIGKMIEGGHERAFFESRLPGLGVWARRECRDQGLVFDDLTKNEQLKLAETYFNTTKTVNGKEVPIDRLIRIYTGAGCKFTRVVPDAYDDAPSMNFGAVGIYENPLPKVVRNNRAISYLAGKTVQLLAKSHWLMSKAF